MIARVFSVSRTTRDLVFMPKSITSFSRWRYRDKGELHSHRSSKKQTVRMKEKKSQRKLNLYFSKFVICHHQNGKLMYLKNYQKNGKKCIQNNLNQLKLVFKACVSGLSISYPKIIHMLNIFSLFFFFPCLHFYFCILL